MPRPHAPLRLGFIGLGGIGYGSLKLCLEDDLFCPVAGADTSAEMREPMEAYMRSIVQMLRGEGFDIVLAPVCRIKKEFEQAIDAFMEQDVAAIITQHLAYSPSLESINALKRVGVPIIVLNTTPDYDLIDRAGYYNGINNNHGIHGVQDMCNLLLRNGKRFFNDRRLNYKNSGRLYGNFKR